MTSPAQDFDDDAPAGGLLTQRIGLIAGIAAFVAMQIAGPPAALEPKAWAALSLLALMVVWWVTEAIPVAATALLPLPALPLLGVAKPADAAAGYSDPIIFLFIGGFMVAAAIERWGLHRRIALMVLTRTGGSPAAIVGGFMLATAGLSMWISNTATALMMMPIALAVANAAEPSDAGARRRLMAACALGVAYAASLGGMGTPIGSPTNLIGMRWLEGAGESLAFVQWMALGVPLILLTVPAGWLFLTRFAFRLPGRASPDAVEAIAREGAALGPMSPAQGRVMAVFGCVALAWMFREPLSTLPGLTGLTDMVIALIGAIALFLIPAGGGEPKGSALLDWTVAERIPWGIAILFGGGLTMAAMMEDTGVSQWIGGSLGWLAGLPIALVILTLVLITVFASELASNVATLTAMLPVLTAVAAATGIDPLTIGMAATFAASLGFMLPVATAANAIAYATGAPKQAEMLRWGLVMNLTGVAAIALVVWLLGPIVTG